MILPFLYAAVAFATVFDADGKDPNPALTEKRVNAMRSLTKEQRARNSCAELDAFSRSLPPAPPASCPEVKEYWDRVKELDAGNRETCRAQDAFLSEFLLDPDHCQAGERALEERLERVEDASDNAVKHLNASAVVDHVEDTLDQPPKGELLDPACRGAAKAVFAFRYPHAGIAEAHWSVVHGVVRETCER